MNTSIYNFCKEGDFANKIYNLLADDLLGKAQLDKIITRYQDMKDNFDNYPKDYVKNGKKEWQFSEGLTPFQPEGYGNYYQDTTAVPIPITHSSFKDLTSRCKKKGAIGLDLPTWFIREDKDPFVMIVTQDPLRDAKWYGDKIDPKFICNDAIVSTPFGLQDAHHRNRGNGGKRIWLLVNELLNKGYNVYLTDCRKYFVYSHKESDKYTTSDKIEIYRRILKKEIDIVNPKLIVSLGQAATEYLKFMLGEDKRQSGYLPHLSGSANATIKTFLSKYFNQVPKNVEEQAGLYAKYILNIIKEKQ